MEVGGVKDLKYKETQPSVLPFKKEDESYDPKNDSIFQKLEHNCQVMTRKGMWTSVHKHKEWNLANNMKIETDSPLESTKFLFHENHKIINCFLKAVDLW